MDSTAPDSTAPDSAAPDSAAPDHPAGPTTDRRLLDRRQLLRAAGAVGLAGVGVTMESQLPGGRAPASAATSAPHIEPMDLTFSIVDQHRPFDLVAPGFVQLRDDFGTDTGSYEVLAPAPESDAGTVSVGSGRLSVTGDSCFALLKSDTRQEAPFGTVVVDVASFAGSGGSQDTVFAGLVKDAANYVAAWYNRATGEAGLDLVLDGTTQTLGTVAADLSTPCRWAFSLTGTTVVALVDEGAGFRPLLRHNLAGLLDLRRPSALAAYANGFGVRTSSGTVTLDRVEAGYYGQAGLRDPHLVTHADGSPYIVDNKAYLTFTQAGLAFFETAHWGVWTLDLDSYRMEQVSNLFFMREGMDAVLGDHAGHLVRDEPNDRWIVSTSTWGDFSFEGVEVNYATVPASTDLLSGVHVLESTRLPLPIEQLPTAAVGQWDPHIVRIRGRWYVAFVNARRFFSFYPALARSAPGADFTELSLVGADDRKVETEGTVMQRVGHEWYLLASNGDASPAAIQGRYPVYDLEMTQVGLLDAPHPTNIPWPMVFPVPLARGRTRWLLVTFNGTQYHQEVLGYGTHGDVLVMEAEPVTSGHEFPPG